MANDTKIYVGELGAKALYRRLKEQIGKITTYQKVTNVTQEGVPVVDNPNTRTIYLVKDETVIGDDKYKEWIWNSVDLWECIGTTSIPENAWKQWSEDNGSTGSADSVYIGKNIVLGRDESYSLGKDNTVEVTDDTVYTGTDVVEIGTSNTATNAANAYQLGRENTVSGHNISYVDPTLHGLALNVGRNNAITSEGVNLGKDNAASYFGVNIGQRNEAHNSSYSMGNRVYANNASFAIGNGESNVLTSTITLASYQLSDSTYVHASQFRQKAPYTYCKLAAIYFNETTDKYEWIQIDDYGRTAIWGGNGLSLLVNDDLKTYLSTWTSYASAGNVVGYFDTNGNFVADASNPASKTYYKVVSVTAKNGGSIPLTFYASMQDASWPKRISDLKTYVGRPNPNYKYPNPGTILNEAQYAELRQNTIQTAGAYEDVYINPNDLSGTVYRSSNGYYPVIGDYEVYGFDKDNEFVPYNEITGKDVQPADCYWKTVTIDKIGTHTFKYDEVFDEPVRIQSNNNSIVLSNGLAEIDEHSIALVSNVYSAKVDILGEQKSSFSFTTVTFTVGTLDQSTGRASWNSSITMQCPNVVGSSDYTNTIAFPKAVVDDDSIGIIGAGSTTYSRVNGASIGIGSGLTVQGYSFGIGRDSDVSGASYSIGKNNIVSSKSYVFGQDNTSIREESIALGCLNYEIGDFYIGESRYYGRAVALGYNNRQVAQQSVAIGTNNSTVYYNSVCIGSNHNTVKDSAVSIGVGNSRIGSASIAMGSGLYDVDGSSICFGMGSTATSASFVAGNGCAGSSAIVMGMGAKGYGGSIVFGNGSEGRNGAVIFGIGNKATEAYTSVNPDNFYANAVVLGIGNQVRNVRESLYKNGWTSMVTTCGIAIGSYIKGYGHNFISLGCRNTLGDPDQWNADSRSTVTDNDGFMTAIGFDCVAFRNYDFAYGYQSTAKGGENIAFQHSTATGYRNIAMVDSTVNGTGNIGIMESIMNVELSGSYQDTYALTHNTLINAVLTSSDRIPSGYGVHHNLLMSVTASMFGSSGAVGNLIYGGRNRTEYSYMYNPVTLNTSSAAVTGNIVLGNMTSGTSITVTSGIRNNMIVNPEQMSITSQNTVAVNTFVNSSVSLSNSNIVMYNFMHCSSITGTVGPLTNNVLFGNSNIESSFYDQSIGVYKNVLFSNSMLTHTNNKRPWNSGQYQPTGENFLVGTKAEDTLACVSFSDRNPGNSTSDSPILSNCLRVFNFGDNTIQRSTQSAIFGGKNQLMTSRRVFISGDNNKLNGQANSSVNDSNGNISSVTVFGNDNTFYSSSATSVERSFVRGDGNKIYTGCHDLATFGNYNQIGIGSEPTYTEIATISAFNQAISANVLIRAKTSSPMPLPGIYETKTSGTTYYNGWYVLYANGLLYNTWTTPASYTSITGANLITGYLAGTLTENAWYKVSANYTLTSGQTVYTGELTETSNYYILGNGKAYKDSSTYWNDRDFITGDNNNIYCGINDSLIFGNDNLISRSVGNYSHDFIQGNNNTLTDGSGSVIIGSGSTATGHMAIAIGNQLKANQWQTVIGKYNSPIDGPGRLADPATEPNKALFIVGNGYSETEGRDWRNEGLIHRSNAMVVYADGTVTAHDFVSDNELTLDGQNGISVTDDLVNSKVVISLDTDTANLINFLKSKPSNGTYGIQSTDGVLSWVAIGTV